MGLKILVIFGVLFYFQQGNAMNSKNVVKESANCTIINMPENQPGYGAIEDAVKKDFNARGGSGACYCCKWDEMTRMCLERCCTSVKSAPTGKCSKVKK